MTLVCGSPKESQETSADRAFLAADRRHDSDGVGLMTTHAIEVVVWSWAYSVVIAAPAGDKSVYFAFVNYTTLGHGDVFRCRNGSCRPNDGDERLLLFGGRPR